MKFLGALTLPRSKACSDPTSQQTACVCGCTGSLTVGSPPGLPPSMAAAPQGASAPAQGTRPAQAIPTCQVPLGFGFGDVTEGPEAHHGLSSVRPSGRCCLSSGGAMRKVLTRWQPQSAHTGNGGHIPGM